MKRIKLYSFISIIVVAAIIVFGSCQKDDENDNGPQKYSIGGTVEGLLGSGLVLQNNNYDDIAISENGAFTFPSALEDSSEYDVTIEAYPEGQTCYVENENGIVDGENVTDIRVICETPNIVGNCSSGSITYYHDLTIEYEGFYQNEIVSGSIPFTCDGNGNLSGSGTCLITVDGTITAPCLESTFSGTANLDVVLTGQFSPAQVTVNLAEVWYVGSPIASGTVTDICDPDVTPFSYPLVEMTISELLTFPTIDGYTIERPFCGAGAGFGYYSWTLYIE